MTSQKKEPFDRAAHTSPAPRLRIQIQRAGHVYYYNRSLNGGPMAGHIMISRESAHLVISMLEPSGSLPPGINLDACHPRSWTWEKDLIL